MVGLLSTLFLKKCLRRKKMGKGGTPPPTSSTVTQTNLPGYVEPYFKDLLTRGEAESKRAYEPYQESRRTGITAGQQDAIEAARAVARQGVGGAEHGLASQALGGAAQYGVGPVGYGYDPERAAAIGYTPGQIGSTYTAGAGPSPYQAGTISGAYDPSQIAASIHRARLLLDIQQAR
jgi:hypothetical protein